jgi:hypothetical protein
MRLLQTLAAFGGRHAKEWLTTVNTATGSTSTVTAAAAAAAGHDAVSAAVASLQVRDQSLCQLS